MLNKEDKELLESVIEDLEPLEGIEDFLVIIKYNDGKDRVALTDGAVVLYDTIKELIEHNRNIEAVKVLRDCLHEFDTLTGLYAHDGVEGEQFQLDYNDLSTKINNVLKDKRFVEVNRTLDEFL